MRQMDGDRTKAGAAGNRLSPLHGLADSFGSPIANGGSGAQYVVQSVRVRAGQIMVVAQHRAAGFLARARSHQPKTVLT